MNIDELVTSLHFSSIFWQLITPIIFNVLDIVTGFIQAVINRNVDSSKMRVGLLHKILLIICVFLSFIIDLAFGLNIVSKVICTYIVIMELFSILENLTKAGINLGKITEILNIKEGKKDGKNE